jgi:hypothetical protein
MTDSVSNLGAALQASLDNQLLKAISQVTGIVSNLPGNAENPSSPLVLSGTIIPQPPSATPGQVTVQTSQGQLNISLNDPAASLPKGTVSVFVQPGSPPTATIVAQNPSTPTPVQLTPNTVQATPDTATNAAQAASLQSVAVATTAIPVLAAGQIVTATVLPPLTQSLPATPALPPAPAPAAVSAQAASAAATPAPPTGTLILTAVNPADGTPSGPAYVPNATVPGGLPGTSLATDPEIVEQPAGQQQGQVQAQLQTLPAGSNVTSAPVPAQAASEEAVPVSNTALPAPQPGTGLPVPAGPSFSPTAAQLQSSAMLATPVPVSAAAVTSEIQSFLVLKVSPPTVEDEPDVTEETNTDQAPASATASPGANTAAASTGSAYTPVANAFPQGQPFTATVVAQSQANQPLLSSAGAALLLTQPAQATPGSEVMLQRVTTPQQTGQASSQPGAAAYAPPLTLQPIALAGRPSWPALTQLVETLNSVAPQVATDLTASLPRVGSQFVDSLLAFLAPARPMRAEQAADGMKSLTAMGGTKAAQAIGQLKTLLTQVQSELSTGGAKAGAAQQSGAWHAYPVPLMNGPSVEMLQFFVRQQIEPDNEKPGGDPKKNAAATRFLVEVSPSALGPVQLDGLLRKLTSQPTRLDLIVRTSIALPDSAYAEMKSLYETALVSSGLGGSVKFQTGRAGFVTPRSDQITHVTRMV